MRKILGTLLALGVIAFTAPPAKADIAAVYASGQGGVQSGADAGNGLGYTLGARILIFDGYFDRMAFGQDVAVTRGILGLRAGFGTNARLVLRAGAGTIHEQHGALTGSFGGDSRTGAVARAGAAVEGRLNPFLYLGFAIDGERYRFPSMPFAPSDGSDVLASLRLTFELGI